MVVSKTRHEISFIRNSAKLTLSKGMILCSTGSDRATFALLPFYGSFLLQCRTDRLFQSQCLPLDPGCRPSVIIDLGACGSHLALIFSTIHGWKWHANRRA